MLFSKDKLTPSEVIKENQDYIKSLGEFVGWQDFFEGGAGQTILELISGAQSINTHHEVMRVREGSLQHAKLDSSITELAVNKGVYRPTGKAYTISIKFMSELGINVRYGELLGTYGDQNIYSLENKIIYKGSNILDITIGIVKTEEYEIDYDGNFYTFDAPLENEILGDHFEKMTINGDDVVVSSHQMNLYHKDLKNSIIRIPYANTVRFVFGDGVIGQKTQRGDKIIYKYLSYSNAVTQQLKPSDLSFLNNSVFQSISITIKRQATKYLDKEILRRVALRSTIDGRWVQPLDYENGILKEYGEYLYDAKVVDSYPGEKIYILPKPQNYTSYLEREIFILIENKRTNATKIDTVWIDPLDENNYYNFTFKLQYMGMDSNETIKEKIQILKDILEKDLFTSTSYIKSTDLAVELTKLLEKGKMYSIDDEIVEIEEFKFINNINIEYTIL